MDKMVIQPDNEHSQSHQRILYTNQQLTRNIRPKFTIENTSLGHSGKCPLKLS